MMAWDRQRFVAAAAYGGASAAGVGALGAVGYGVLRAEAVLARRAIGEPTDELLARVGRVRGVDHEPLRNFGDGSGRPVRVAVLGDSSAVGYGVERPDQTIGAIVAAELTSVTGRPVSLVDLAVVGAESAELDEQVDRMLATTPEQDVALILIGANDITHGVRPKTAARRLGAVVQRLVDAGIHVVVGTCPDLGVLRPLPQPLRWYCGRMSNQLARRQTVAVVGAGGRSVSLGDLLAADFDAHPELMFSIDRFHPSSQGYAVLARALLPAVRAALGIDPDRDAEGGLRHRTPRFGEVHLAAADAVAHPGTEVSGAVAVPGRAWRPQSLWAVMKRPLARP